MWSALPPRPPPSNLPCEACPTSCRPLSSAGTAHPGRQGPHSPSGLPAKPASTGGPSLLARHVPPAALCLLTQAGKVWADRYQRRLHASQAGGRLERALSLRSGAGLEWSKFAAGAEAAFPLLRPAPSHAAQHLLLDARLPATAGAAGAAAGAESGAEPASFAAVAELLRGALADTGLLQRAAALAPGAAQAQQARQGAAQAQQGGEAETALFPCHNGYAALVWHADTASLSSETSGMPLRDPAAACCCRVGQGCGLRAAHGGRPMMPRQDS